MLTRLFVQLKPNFLICFLFFDISLILKSNFVPLSTFVTISMVAVMFSVVVATSSQVLFHSFPARWTQLLLLLLLFTAAAARLVLSFEFLTVLVLRMRSRVDCVYLTVSY
jgi:hypothetical protein